MNLTKSIKFVAYLIVAGASLMPATMTAKEIKVYPYTGCKDDETFSFQIDDSGTVGSLRAKIAEKLSVNPLSFFIYITGSNSGGRYAEVLKDDQGFGTYPLQHEYSVKIFQLKLKKDSQELDLSEAQALIPAGSEGPFADERAKRRAHQRARVGFTLRDTALEQFKKLVAATATSSNSSNNASSSSSSSSSVEKKDEKKNDGNNS